MLKSIRKIGLLVSSFALACSVALGMALLPKTVATAEDGMSISTADLVGLHNNVEVTPAYNGMGLYFNPTNNKNTALTAALNGAFNGDLTLEYSLKRDGNVKVYFHFYDAEDNLVFSVGRYNKYANVDTIGNSAAFVSYTENATKKYSYLNTSSVLTISESLPGTNGMGNALPDSSVDGIEDITTGTLTLDWSDNNRLAIKHTYVSGEQTIAELDLSAYTGLSSNYKMKIGYDTWNANIDVLLRSVNGVSLAGETVAVTKPTTAITYEGETEVNGVATINLAKGENLGNFIATKPATVVGGNWTVAAAENETFSYAEDFSSKNSGTYALSVENGGFTKQYNVVIGTSIATKDLIENSENTTVTAEYDAVGLNISGKNAVVNGVFNGDLSFEYSIMNQGAAPSYFDFFTADGETLVFRIVRYSKWNDSSSIAYVMYKSSPEAADKYVYINTSSELQEQDTEPLRTASHLTGALPTWHKKDTNYDLGEIVLDWSDNNQLAVQVEYSSGMKNIANLDLSAWGNLSSAYRLKLTTKSTFAAMSQILLRSVNGVSLAGETVAATKVANSVSDIAYTGASNNEIVVSQNAMLGNFVAKADYVVAGNWTVEADEEFAVEASTYSTATLGDSTLTVTNENYSEDFNLKVIYKTLEDLDLEMAYGASVRIGSSDGHNGIRFSMCIEDYEAWQASIGEGQYYTSVSYGMFIMPSDYYTATGAYTLENLFGEKAIYTWKNKAEAYGTTQILHRSGSQMFWDEKNSWWAFNYSITDIHKDNIGRDFVALGYVELTLSDGSVVRKLAQFNEGNIANNTRSAYTVAKKAIEAGIDETSALWLKANYIDVVENPTVEE